MNNPVVTQSPLRVGGFQDQCTVPDSLSNVVFLVGQIPSATTKLKHNIQLHGTATRSMITRSYNGLVSKFVSQVPQPHAHRAAQGPPISDPNPCVQVSFDFLDVIQRSLSGF